MAAIVVAANHVIAQKENVAAVTSLVQNVFVIIAVARSNYSPSNIDVLKPLI